MGNGNFWAGAALGALTVGAAAIASSSTRCCRSYSNPFLNCYTGFNSFGYNSFGYNSFGLNTFGFNSFSPFGYGYCCIPKYVGETPFESFGFSNHTLAQLPLGYFIA